MPFRIDWPELLVVLAIVLLVCGVGRITKIASELGSGIRAFRKGLREDDDEKKSDDETKPQP